MHGASAKGRAPSRYETLSDLLRAKFPGLSQRQIAVRLGVDSSTVTRWFRDSAGQPPTMDRCLRIARACRVNPLLVFELAGRSHEYSALFEYYGGQVPSVDALYSSDEVSAGLMSRADKLLKRGWQGRFEEKLLELESYWDVNRSAFESVVRRMGARTGFLLISHGRIDRDVVYALGIEEGEAEVIAAKPLPTRWQVRTHEDSRLDVRLYVRHSNPIGPEIDPVLAAWCACFISLLAAESTARRR